ncbi:MAG: hypothetical protein ACI85O_000819, partial [Saprospiraceae bacterium]
MFRNKFLPWILNIKDRAFNLYKSNNFSMKYIFLLLSVCFSCTVFAQNNDLSNDNFIYKNNIRTVRFHINGLPVSNPIIDLGRSATMLLTFDDMEGDDKDYSYRIRHYNMDWTESDMSEADFIEGFVEGDIRDFGYAFNTKTNFTHYALMLPNEDVVFELSGNYTVTIFNDYTDENILTRRFVVVEPIALVSEKMVRPTKTDKQDTHHEFDFSVKHEQVGIKRPLMELTATVLQNGRWDNALTGIKPRFSNNGTSEFDYQDKVIFPAGLEFRYADLRSLDGRQLGVFDIEEADDGYDVTLKKDKKRFQKGFSSYIDINGDFIIENIDYNQVPGSGIIQALQGADVNDASLTSSIRSRFVNTAEEYLQEEGINSMACDYAYVTFSLVSPTEYYDHDVYIFGKLTDWQVKPEFKLNYNDEYNAYIGE